MKTHAVRTLPVILGILSLGLVFVASPSASASELSGILVVETLPKRGNCPEVAKVRAWWRVADQAARLGDFQTALRHSKKAYQTFPRASTAYRVATYYERSGDQVQAFEWYLTARNYAPRKALERRIMASLKRTGAKTGLGVVRVNTNPRGGPVDIDGSTTAKGGAWFGLSARTHTVSANTTQKKFASQRLTVEAGSIQTVVVSSKPATAPSLLHSQLVKPAEKASIAVPLGLILGGVAAAGLGAGLHVWGLDLRDDAAAAAKIPGRPPFIAPRNVDDGADQRLAAGLLYGVGGAAILAGLIVWATQDTAAADASAPALTLSPTLVPRGGGFTLGGHF